MVPPEVLSVLHTSAPSSFRSLLSNRTTATCICRGFSTAALTFIVLNGTVLSWLQCCYVAIFSHALLTATSCVGGVSVVAGDHHGAVSQGCSDITGQWDTLWEGPTHGVAMWPIAKWVSVRHSGAVSDPVGVVGCQAVILQNEVTFIIIVTTIITVTLSNAVAVVTKHMPND